MALESPESSSSTEWAVLYSSDEYYTTTVQDEDWGNDTINCTAFPYIPACMDVISQLKAYIFPSLIEWFLITAHLIVFSVGLVGNALVCMAVYRNNSMRTVTNFFIFNLAVADFMVILFCLPPTVVWDTTETWFFGNILCKIILYIQVRDLDVGA
jgi:hypothetical protein